MMMLPKSKTRYRNEYSNKTSAEEDDDPEFSYHSTGRSLSNDSIAVYVKHWHDDSYFWFVTRTVTRNEFDTTDRGVFYSFGHYFHTTPNSQLYHCSFDEKEHSYMVPEGSCKGSIGLTVTKLKQGFQCVATLTPERSLDAGFRGTSEVDTNTDPVSGILNVETVKGKGVKILCMSKGACFGFPGSQALFKNDILSYITTVNTTDKGPLLMSIEDIQERLQALNARYPGAPWVLFGIRNNGKPFKKTVEPCMYRPFVGENTIQYIRGEHSNIAKSIVTAYIDLLSHDNIVKLRKDTAPVCKSTTVCSAYHNNSDSKKVHNIQPGLYQSCRFVQFGLTLKDAPFRNGPLYQQNDHLSYFEPDLEDPWFRTIQGAKEIYLKEKENQHISQATLLRNKRKAWLDGTIYKRNDRYTKK
jgi:hypothetical protein